MVALGLIACGSARTPVKSWGTPVPAVDSRRDSLAETALTRAPLDAEGLNAAVTLRGPPNRWQADHADGRRLEDFGLRRADDGIYQGSVRRVPLPSMLPFGFAANATGKFAVAFQKGRCVSVFDGRSVEDWDCSGTEGFMFIDAWFVDEELYVLEQYQSGMDGGRGILRTHRGAVLSRPWVGASPPLHVQGPRGGHFFVDSFDGDVWADGVRSLAKKYGHARIEGFQLLDAGELYFFRDGVGDAGPLGVSFDGHVFPNRYDGALHDGCCDRGVLDPDARGFYAHRGSQWFYVRFPK